MVEIFQENWAQFVDLTAQYVGYAWRQQEDQSERFDWPNMPLHELHWPLLGSFVYLTGK